MRLEKSSLGNLSYSFSRPGNYRLLGINIPDKLSQIAQEKPNDVCYKFCFCQRAYTFAQLKHEVDELAQGLLNLGFLKGDRLGVMLPNIPELTITILAAASIGAIVVVLKPAFQIVEVEYMMRTTRAKGMIILETIQDIDNYEILKKICPELESSRKGELHSANLPELKHVIVASLMPNTVRDEHKYKGTWSFNEIQKYNNSSSIESNKQFPFVDIDDPFILLFTSGTTGKPKGTVLSQSSLLYNSNYESTVTNCYESNRIVCCHVPLFHMFGLLCGLLSPISSGITVVVPNYFPDTVMTMKAIQNEKCTALKGSPLILFDIFHHPDLESYDLSSLEQISSGAAVVPKSLIVGLKQKLGIKHIIILYGMTECCIISTTTVDDVELGEKYAYESIGRPYPFVEMKIVDLETRQMIPYGVDGEICVRGFGNMIEYWEAPDKTAELIDSNGWLRTGDIGCMDEYGYIYYKSRIKEQINRGGVKIYPAELECFLRTHNAVQDCYVFGVPSERYGEEVCVWIKLKNQSQQVDTNSIIDFCKQNIAYYKIPKYIKFVDSFPSNETGKIQKFKMLEQMKSELGF